MCLNLGRVINMTINIVPIIHNGEYHLRKVDHYPDASVLSLTMSFIVLKRHLVAHMTSQNTIHLSSHVMDVRRICDFDIGEFARNLSNIRDPAT